MFDWLWTIPYLFFPQELSTMLFWWEHTIINPIFLSFLWLICSHHWEHLIGTILFLFTHIHIVSFCKYTFSRKALLTTSLNYSNDVINNFAIFVIINNYPSGYQSVWARIIFISLSISKGALYNMWASSVQFTSVSQSCPTLSNPMNRRTPGLIVHHKLPEFTQTHVHRVSDAIQPSLLLSSPSLTVPNPSQHQGLFQWVNSSYEVAKVLEFQLQHQSLKWTPRNDLL